MKRNEPNSQLISVIIPVYRSGEILLELTERLCSFFESRNESFEIVFVEDCGGDDSWEIINKLTTRNDNIFGIRLSRNYGQHNALLCGIRAAKGNVLITMDDDLQHPPEELPKLLNRYAEGHDVVYGAPLAEPQGMLRNLASQITKLVLRKSMGTETARHISAWRVFNASLKSAFEHYRSPSVNIDVMLTWATTNFSMVRVRHDPRKVGVSGYTVRALIRHAFNMMTGFSPLPLQIASVIGLVFASFGIIVLAYVLIIYFVWGAVVQGFAFLASIIAIFSGAQLLAIGVIGEYLSRIHFRTMDRPPYVIGDETKGE